MNIVNVVGIVIVVFLLIRIDNKLLRLISNNAAISEVQKTPKTQKKTPVFSLEFAEQYAIKIDDQHELHEFNYDTSRSPIYFRSGTFPTGWETDTLSYINKDDQLICLYTIRGGVWQQVNAIGNTTFPIPHGYC